MSDIVNEAVVVLNEKLAGSDFDGTAKFDIEGEGTDGRDHGAEPPGRAESRRRKRRDNYPRALVGPADDRGTLRFHPATLLR